MTRTRRRYNLPGYLFWHPWRQHPGWHSRIALRRKRKAAIEGLLRGLEDFIEGRCTHFKNDEELEEYLMELPESMRTNLEASLKRNKEAFDCLKSL